MPTASFLTDSRKPSACRHTERRTYSRLRASTPSRLRGNGQIGLSAGIIAAAGIVIAAAAAAAIVIYAGTAGEQTACLVALRRKKGVDGEVEAREDLARILLTADTAVRAVAPRQTYVVSGHEQLNVALKSDDRELTEGYEQLIAIVAEHEIVTAEARAD